MPFPLFLALRYLRGGRNTLGGALTSAIAVGSVTVGVAALVATLAVMTGFREDIRNKILGAQPHLIVLPQSGGGLPEGDYTPDFEGVSDVLGWAPFVMEQALLKKGAHTQGAVIKGIDPLREPAVTGLSKHVKAGRWDALASTGAYVLLGSELAKTLEAEVGDNLVLVVPSASASLFGDVPALYGITVGGVLETGLYDYDSSLAVVSLGSAQRAFGKKGLWSGLGVKTADPDDPFGAGLRIQKNMGSSVYVRSWLMMNRNLFAALKLEKVVMFFILALITLVAAFTILSNLVLVTAQKTREIGILKAMGATDGTIRLTFLIKGLLMGGFGTGLGTLLGLAISWALKTFPVVRLPADVYYVEKLPVVVVPSDVFSVVGAAMVIVLAATLYPARVAARLDALSAIRQ